MGRILTLNFGLNSTTAGVELDLVDTPIGDPGLSIQGTIKRSGSYALKAKANGSTVTAQLAKRNITTIVAGRTYYVRTYIYIVTYPEATKYSNVFNLTDSALTHGLTVALLPDGTASVSDIDLGSMGTTTATLGTGSWIRVELSYVCNSGAIDLRFDGTSVLTNTASSGIGMSLLSVGNSGNNTQGEWYFADIAVNDDQGSYQNSWPGSGKVIYLRPNAAGDSAQWTPSSGDNYACVNETPPDDHTSYVGVSTVNYLDMYNCDASGIGASDVVNVVEVGGRFARSASASPSFKFRIIKTGSGTEALSAAIQPDNTQPSYKTNTLVSPMTSPIILYKDPDGTNAWTQTTLDSMQIGMVETTDTNRTLYVTSVWAIVDYTPASGAKNLGGTVASASRLAGPTPHLYMKLRAGSVASGTAVATIPLRLKMGLRGTIASTTAMVMGKLRFYMKLGGVVASATRVVAGTPHLIMKFGGAIASTSAFIANLTGTGSRLLAGAIASGTSFTARFSLSMFFGGVIASGTSIIGDLISQSYKYLGGIIASVTSIFGAPGGAVDYWGIAGVTEPQHLWPFSQTGDYTDQGSTGGLDLTAQGSGNSFSSDGLVLNGSGNAYHTSDADICDIGGTFSILFEVVISASDLDRVGCRGPTTGWQEYYIQGSSLWAYEEQGKTFSKGGWSLTDKTQWILTLAGGTMTLYMNGSFVKSEGSIPDAVASSEWFQVGNIGEVSTVTRVGILKGEAWSADDVTAIYAGPAPGAGLGVNITIRKFLSGVIASATEVLGSVTRVAAAVLHYLSGVIVSGTAVAGNLLQAFNLQGSIASGTSVLGQMRRGLHLSGVIQSVTSVLGRLKLAMGLSGRVVSTTAVLGMLKMGRRLSGVIASGTAVLGRIKLAMHLSGVIASTTSVLGNLFGITTQFLAGVIVSGTAVVMDIKRYGTHLLSGVIASATAVTGGLLIRRFLSGVIASATAVTGMVSRGLYLTGSIITTSTILGAIKQVPTQFLSGAIASGTYVYGGLKNVGAKYLAGVIATATYVFGNFSDIPAGGVVAGTRHFLKAFKGRLFQMYNRAKKNLHIEP